MDGFYNLGLQNWTHKLSMHRTQRNLNVFTIILTELYSSSFTIYPQHAFAPEDNQQKYSEILQQKYHFPWHSQLSFGYKDLCQIVFEGNDLHLVDNYLQFIIIWLIISFRIISKHFKMYITINDVIGEKTIDLSYPIHPRKEIAVVSIHSSNSQILLHRSIEVLLKTGKKIVLNKGVYMDKELNSLIGMELKSQMLDSCNDILRTNKLERIMKMIISLNELNNSDNLEDGRPSNILFTYYVISSEHYMLFEPQSPQYKNLKNDTITSLTLAKTNQNNDIITDGPGGNCGTSYSIIKMYITINNIKGEKRIDLSYSIQNFDSGKEITVIRMLSDNVKYEILKLCAVMDPISDTKKTIPSGTYAGRELLSIVEGIVELNQFEVDDQVIKTNKLKGIKEMIINLDELNYSINLKDGRPSNTLFTYHVIDDKDFTLFEPKTPQYKKLKNGEFTYLNLRITDQNNNIITDGPQVTVVVHIRDFKI